MRTFTIIIGLLAVFALAACGEDEPAGANAESKNRDAALKFAECMREHGVDMADPGTGGKQVLKVGPNEDTTPEEMEEAQKACEKYQPEPPELSEEEQQEMREAALEHARCMRENGIEDFPDPTFDEDGGAEIRLGKGLDPEDPDFQEAQEACEDKMPGLGKTSVGGGP
jgi:hypothetical protein